MANKDMNISNGELRRLELEASAVPEQGELLSFDASNGYAHELVAGEDFAGIARTPVYETPASNGDGTVEAVGGIFQVEATPSEITGLSGAKTDIGTKIYASNGFTLTTSATGNTLIGRVSDYVNGKYIITCATIDVGGVVV